MESIYGVMKQSDHQVDEYIYTVGQDNQIPLILLVLQATERSDSVPRYLSMFGFTQTAKEVAKDIIKKNPHLNKEIKNIVDIFNECDAVSQERKAAELIRSGQLKNGVFSASSLKPTSPTPKNIADYPRDTIMDFHIYAHQLAEYMVMLTPNYETGYEGVPATCSMKYIAYYSREEFVKATEAINTAFNHIVNDITRIMKIRNIDVDENNMTVHLPGYKAVSFRMNMYPGF